MNVAAMMMMMIMTNHFYDIDIFVLHGLGTYHHMIQQS